jgi:RNA-directed DNA polymerase
VTITPVIYCVGGVISPCLLNVALHGLEEAAGVRYKTSGIHAGETVAGSPVAVRYADDMVVLCHSQQQAEQVKARLAVWLAPRGLAFNEDKTKIAVRHEAARSEWIRRWEGRRMSVT